MEIRKSDAFALKKKSGAKGTFEGFAKDDRIYWRIKQLLKEANAAKDQGQWGKAENILWELRRITRLHGNFGGL